MLYHSDTSNIKTSIIAFTIFQQIDNSIHARLHWVEVEETIFRPEVAEILIVDEVISY